MNQKGSSKIFIGIIIVIVLFVAGVYFILLPYLLTLRFDLEKHVEVMSGRSEGAAVSNTKITIEGVLGSEEGGTKNILVYYKPGTDSRGYFYWKECKNCEEVTQALFIGLLDKENRFLDTSVEGKKLGYLDFCVRVKLMEEILLARLLKLRH